jgi:class 3 adenylate cyclase
MIPPNAAAILEQLGKKDATVLNLLALCRTEPYLGVWEKGPELPRKFARLLLRQGHPTLALEVAARAVGSLYPNDHELMYCRALALAKSGNPTRADLFVQALIARPDLPAGLRVDAISLAGRVRKDFAARTAAGELRTARFREAFGFYHQAYTLTGDTFPGINAATLALLSGNEEQALRLATEVRDKVLDMLEQEGKDRDYWLLATLADAYVLLEDNTAAKGRYAQAIRLALDVHAYGDVASIFRQLHLLSAHRPVNDLLGLFRLGPVVVFAGHGIDWPGDPVRFPACPALERAVRRAIKTELDALEPNIGYCIPGCGSDILFGELMRERDAELHVVLPFDEQDFISHRLTYGLKELELWRQRYEGLRGLLRVTRHFATVEAFLNDQVLYDFAGTFMQGLALTRAAQVDVSAIALVVRDPTHPMPPGLAKFISNWKSSPGRELREINLDKVRRGVADLTPVPLPTPPELPKFDRPPREVQAMLFADVAGFSGLPEPHLPAFFIGFLAIVRKELEKSDKSKILFENTWGDGLYIVFADVVTASEFALRLLSEMEVFNFERFGFQLKEDKKPGVRIGLHTGPVFKGHDAVLGKNNYFGSHVSRAARIEPVTAPGCAFVSEQFAAALALADGHDFLCEYLGMQPLAKDFDNNCPLYRLTTGTDRVDEKKG